MKKIILVLFVLFLAFYTKAQTSDTLVNRNQALKVYMDCGYCDMTYFKQNFTLVNYVRDRKVADVQIIVSTMRNGGGGTEYTIQFFGLGRFSHMKDTLVFNSKADDTWDEIRDKELETIKKGLVPYILKTPFADKLIVKYMEDKKNIKEEDPWNNWVFNLGANSWLNGERSYNTFNVWTSASASRITGEIKHETEFNMNYSENEYRLYDGNDSLIYSAASYRRSLYLSHQTTWSLGDHWGAGISFSAHNSTYSNIDLAVSLTPAVEYNFFKYSDASRKQLRIGYYLGPSYRNYTDTTIYDKMEEFLWSQNIEINFKYITNWGSIRTSLSWDNYLHDFSLYNIGSFVSLNIRLFKGLSFNIQGSFSMPRDQIGLVKEASTPEDVLLRQRELATRYSYFGNIGLSYTFGSIYNNVVNPRLD